MDRLTQIPVHHGENGAERAIFHDVETHRLANELVAVSWALLLSSCVERSQSPVFFFNGDPTKVDIATRTIKPANLECPLDSTSINYYSNFSTVVIECEDSSLRPQDRPFSSPKDFSTSSSASSASSLSPSPSSSASVSASDSSSVLSPPILNSTTYPTATLSWTLNRKSQMSVLQSTAGMDATTLHRLGSQLKQIVHEQVIQSEKRADLLTPESPELSILNPSPELLPGPQLLHELALSGSNDSNNAIEFLAADGNIRNLSYSSLDQLSSKLAAQIIHASSARVSDGRKLVVPVLLPQSLELYIAWLGILKAGGAFCPLNTDAPPDRIEFILQDVAASVVVTQSSLATRVPQDERLAVIKVEDIMNSTGQEISRPIIKASPSPSDLAYVMYTSGSTGRPKGVGISHLAATQSLLAHDDLIPQFNRFLQFASPTFDVSVFEVFFPFFRGATLIGSDREQMLLDISHVMTEMRVDAAELTPTVAGELLRTRAAAPCLKVLLTIGEMLTKHVVEEFGQSEDSDGILHGMYGPTEAAIHCTAATHFQADSAVNLIGKPFSTVSAFIMSLESEDKQNNAELHPLPIGQIGELVVGGPQLADGYINRPEENAKAFIESPFYGRLYRTGDKGRMSSTGEIECFGRISSGQVKLRGQRIELGEIENVICKSSNVRSAVAIVSGGSLAAFVLANDQGTTDRELRDTCRQWLPRFMVPGEFILIDQFPQLPSGKIDRKGLEAEFVCRRNAAQSVDQLTFRDEFEETIASCVFDVLGKNVSVEDSLVSAGLDSLAAIRLASHLLDTGMRLDVARLLEADSVDGIWHLAKAQATSESTEDTQTAIKRIRQLVRDAGAARIEALGLSESVTEIEPCSHIQQAMILETARDTKAYSNWIELQFQPVVTADNICDAFIKLFKQNALLRSGFVEIGLKENSYARFIWNTHDDQKIQRRDVLNYDISLISENDLLHPLRVQLKESSDGVRVVVHIHHALYDGWTWQLILKDLQHILNGEELPPKPAYSIITDFFIEYKISESANESSNFWRDQLQGSPPLAFPSFHSETNLSPKTQEANRELNISISKLNNVCQNLHISRQTIFQAAYCYMLSTYLGSQDVTFGTVFSGRTLPVKGIETVLGPCIRTLPTRMDLNKMQNVTDLMLAIQNMNRKSLEHGSLPLQDIKKASGSDPRRTLFDTALVWQESIWSHDQTDLFREVANGEFLEFAFLLDLEPREDKIHAKMSYQQSILPHWQAQLLLEQIDSVASILIENPSLPIEEIASHLPSSILSISNSEFATQTQTEGDLPNLVSDIERIASTDPYRSAIEIMLQGSSVTESMIIESISYAQLHSRSNRLAHYFTQIGVRKGDLIGLFLEGSIDTMISILALVKIGAGLLSLPHDGDTDADASTKLTNFILATANPRFCIANRSVINYTLPASTSQILIPDSLSDFDDYPPSFTNGFHIICAENPSNNDLMNPNLFTFSSQNLQSHIKALAKSYPVDVSTGSKLLHTSPASAREFEFPIAPAVPTCLLSEMLMFSIIAFFANLLFAWSSGSTFCSCPALDGRALLNLPHIINAMNITHLHSTPSLLASISPEQVPKLQGILVSGERLRASLLLTWAGKGIFEGMEFWNWDIEKFELWIQVVLSRADYFGK